MCETTAFGRASAARSRLAPARCGCGCRCGGASFRRRGSVIPRRVGYRRGGASFRRFNAQSRRERRCGGASFRRRALRRRDTDVWNRFGRQRGGYPSADASGRSQGGGDATTTADGPSSEQRVTPGPALLRERLAAFQATEKARRQDCVSSLGDDAKSVADVLLELGTPRCVDGDFPSVDFHIDAGSLTSSHAPSQPSPTNLGVSPPPGPDARESATRAPIDALSGSRPPSASQEGRGGNGDGGCGSI